MSVTTLFSDDDTWAKMLENIFMVFSKMSITKLKQLREQEYNTKYEKDLIEYHTNVELAKRNGEDPSLIKPLVERRKPCIDEWFYISELLNTRSAASIAIDECMNSAPKRVVMGYLNMGYEETKKQSEAMRQALQNDIERWEQKTGIKRVIGTAGRIGIQFIP